MNLKSQLKLIFGLFLITTLFLMADLSTIKKMLNEINFIHAAVGFFFFFATGLLDNFRLRMASPSARELSWKDSLKMHFESYALVQLLPGNLGSDIYKLTKIGRNSKNYWEPSLILFSLRILSILITILFVGILLVILPEWRNLYSPYFKTITSFSIWPSLILLFLASVISIISYQLVKKKIPVFKDKLSRAYSSVYNLPSSDKFNLFSISLIIILFRVITFIFCLKAFSIEIGVLQAVTIALLANLAWLIPLSPAGIGIREGIVTGLLIWLNVAFEPALLVAILGRTYMLIMGFFGTTFFFFNKKN